MSVQNENFEEIINLPVGSRASRLDVTNNENPEIPLKPILAFNDEGTLGPLPQVDGVQTQQTAGELVFTPSSEVVGTGPQERVDGCFVLWGHK